MHTITCSQCIIVNYALVGRAPEAYSSCRVCVFVYALYSDSRYQDELTIERYVLVEH